VLSNLSVKANSRFPNTPSESNGGANGSPSKTSRHRAIAIHAWIDVDSVPARLCGSLRKTTWYSAPDSSMSSASGSTTLTMLGGRLTRRAKNSFAPVNVADKPAHTSFRSLLQSPQQQGVLGAGRPFVRMYLVEQNRRQCPGPYAERPEVLRRGQLPVD
jgi:hypothetical protein